MGIFSEIESTIFKREEVLSTEYMPAELPHREGEVQQLARNIMPASRGRKPQNTCLVTAVLPMPGSPTTIIRAPLPEAAPSKAD